MTKLETISATAFGLSLLTASVLFWTLIMYQTLQASGAMIAAFG